MKYPHTYKWNLLIKRKTNWLKAEQLEIQTPINKKIEIQTDPTSTSWIVVSIINKEWIDDIDISRIELQFTIFKLILQPPVLSPLIVIETQDLHCLIFNLKIDVGT